MKNKCITMILTALILANSCALASNEVGTNKEEKTPKSNGPDICIVSGDKLGEMGKPVVFEYKGRTIKLCCTDCRESFDKKPKKYLKELDELEAKAAKEKK